MRYMDVMVCLVATCFRTSFKYNHGEDQNKCFCEWPKFLQSIVDWFQLSLQFFWKKLFYKVELEEDEVGHESVYIFDVTRTPLYNSDLEEEYDGESISVYETDMEEEEEEEEYSTPIYDTDGEGEFIERINLWLERK